MPAGILEVSFPDSSPTSYSATRQEGLPTKAQKDPISGQKRNGMFVQGGSYIILLRTPSSEILPTAIGWEVRFAP